MKFYFQSLWCALRYVWLLLLHECWCNGLWKVSYVDLFCKWGVDLIEPSWEWPCIRQGHILESSWSSMMLCKFMILFSFHSSLWCLGKLCQEHSTSTLRSHKLWLGLSLQKLWSRLLGGVYKTSKSSSLPMFSSTIVIHFIHSQATFFILLYFLCGTGPQGANFHGPFFDPNITTKL
jgi:hypothetical protein